MSEEILLDKWRSLPQDKQQAALDFVEFLQSRIELKSAEPQPVKMPTEATQLSNFGSRLQQLRDNIIRSGTPLLTPEEVEQEKAKRRGGYQKTK